VGRVSLSREGKKGPALTVEIGDFFVVVCFSDLRPMFPRLAANS
jgi:hypothetical protein